jgi:hypothetical protein
LLQLSHKRFRNRNFAAFQTPSCHLAESSKEDKCFDPEEIRIVDGRLMAKT